MNEALQVEDRRTAAEMPVNSSHQTNGQEDIGPLLSEEFVHNLRSRWQNIQAAFVDDPRTAVQQADELVNSAISRLSESFTEARNKLEQQWSRGDQANTEDLRIAFRQYRAFFQRILSV